MSAMKFGLKKPCRECPFFAKVRGWIGNHKNAIEFHEIARNDQAMACHMAAKDDEAATNSRKFVCAQLCGENAHCPEWNDDEVPSCYTKHGRKVKVASK